MPARSPPRCRSSPNGLVFTGNTTIAMRSTWQGSTAPVSSSRCASRDDGTVALSLNEALIPLGVQAVEAALQQDVMALAGARYAHADGHAGIARWGRQRGSVYLADQKLPITVPRSDTPAPTPGNPGRHGGAICGGTSVVSRSLDTRTAADSPLSARRE